MAWIRLVSDNCFWGIKRVNENGFGAQGVKDDPERYPYVFVYSRCLCVVVSQGANSNLELKVVQML